ncbi:MAG: DUF480 domain-containing protein [Planctomycetaceae bacterium]
MADEFETAGPPLKELSKGQRRVLGVLLEKAFTTPEAYPLTPKGLTTGCNQKNNRQPLTNYSEDDVLQYVDELRELGLVAVVHTESGRTERYRHYMRKRYQFTEAQLAIITELLLRGRQSVGDLRARASRMTPIDSLDDLRAALQGLQALNLVQADGPLDRRGVEVDHNLYQAREGNVLAYREAAEESTESADDSSPSPPIRPAEPVKSQPTSSASHVSADHVNALENSINQLRSQNASLAGDVEALKEELGRLSGIVGQLQRDLGG